MTHRPIDWLVIVLFFGGFALLISGWLALGMWLLNAGDVP